MLELSQFALVGLLFLPFLLLYSTIKFFLISHKKLPLSSQTHLPKSYPIIGSSLAFLKQQKGFLTWTSDILQSSPSATFVLHRPLGNRNVFTANPANVEHILKTHFHNYPKGKLIDSCLGDLLGKGLFIVDGQKWKFQRKIASHEFNTRSLRKFVEQVVDTELSSRLMPILSDAAKNRTVLDLQDILKRFAFDNICRISFGYDPGYLSASLTKTQFAVAFEKAAMISAQRFQSFFPLLWKLKRFLQIGSEKQLTLAVSEVRELARAIVKEKKTEVEHLNDSSSSMKEAANLDLLSRFMNSGHIDENLLIDIVISFILAGQDTTSAALTWFFWLLSKNPDVEVEVLKEITTTASAGNNHEDDNDHQRHSVLDEVKGMEYTHAALCESMRLYPPVSMDTKEAVGDDVLPDGTEVKKGTRVTYHLYAMGRSEKIWGKHWAEFRPERWLAVSEAGNRKFVARDPYSYPVFQAGPRICLGKEMAFLQMKRLVAGSGWFRRLRMGSSQFSFPA
ncbi:hypothetical protein Dimus_033883 [Dionaea muscipula]